ncbi:hypothetical protein DB345_14320 [Spartobacteria bacterium LR76]|nr:hypothetical protein DB345_14320 [Spartobacteria bacterium LR76]
MKSKHLSSAQGFSLVELLVVIAVIAIIAAIAIPNIANITSGATTAKDQRNAQNIASIAMAARAAGYTNEFASVTALITALRANDGQGITMTNVNGAALNFGVNGLVDADATGAGRFLKIVGTGANNQLVYSQTTNATTN